MSGAVCEMFNCRFSIVDLFLSGGDSGTNRKSDIELVSSIPGETKSPAQLNACLEGFEPPTF
jgi:hypothetical protein